MRIGVLGPVAAWAATGGDVAPSGLRLRGLLARLALAPGRTVTAETLVDDLWGTEPSSANALQALVSRLRRALGPELVATVPGGYRLEVRPADVDAVRAGQRLAEAASESDPEAARELVGQALALWRWPALADVRRLPFAEAAAARLEEKRAAAIEQAAALDLVLGRAAAAVEPLAALLAEQPLRESAAAALARALHATGRQADALALLDRTREQLVEELGVDPGPALAEARMEVLRGTPAPPPPARPARAARPAALTSFVGREADIARLRELLAANRLVTLVGPGGAGKTRLARETAEEAAVAELAPLTGPEQLAETVLAAVGTPELVSRTEEQHPVERLVAALGRREVVLVLDNCEHLVAAAADLAATLLDRCPALRILATSREPLAVPGERLHPVEALDPAAAARLFADRAAAVSPGFDAEAAAGPIAEICRRLDGQPLPIELAAARLRVLTPAEILTRLDDRFRLLTTGSRNVLPRHQTLRAVVDWSWELLDEQERTLARRLAVFAGGATADAAEQVCGEGLADTFGTLAALVDKSLVVAVPQSGDAATRYRMLETIREYARERLAGSGEEDETAARHARWTVALVERAEPELRGREQLRWLALLRAESGNITASLRRAIAVEDAEIAYRLVAGMFWVWLVRGATDESLTWIRAVVAVPEAGAPVDALAAVTALRALEAFSRGALDEAEVLVERGEELAAHVPEPRHPALDLLGPITEAFTAENDAPLAPLSLGHPDPWVRAFALQIRAVLAENAGDITRERELVRSAHALFRQVGDRFGLGMTLHTLGELESLAGNAEAAVAAYEEAIALATELANDDDLPQFLIRRGGMAARAGDHPLARKLYTEARTLMGDSTYTVPEMVEVALADLDRREGDVDGARARLAGLDPARRPGLGVQQQEAHLAVHKTLVELAAGDLPAAATHLGVAVGMGGASRDGPVIGMVAETVALYRLACGDPEGAARALGVAATRRGTLDLGDPAVVEALAAVHAHAAAREAAAALPQQAGLDLLRELAH